MTWRFVHPDHGPCVLRAFSHRKGWLRSSSIAEIANSRGWVVAMRHFSLLELGSDEAQWPQVLAANGVPGSVSALKGPSRFVGIVQDCGESLSPHILAARANQDRDALVSLFQSLASTVGRLHGAGVIADDTHPKQFVVDEAGTVRRIDLDNGRLFGLDGRTREPEEVWRFMRAELPGVFLSSLGFETARSIEWDFVEKGAIAAIMPDEVLRSLAVSSSSEGWERRREEVASELTVLRKAYVAAADLPLPTRYVARNAT